MKREITREYSTATKKLRRAKAKKRLMDYLAEDGTSYRDARRSYTDIKGHKFTINKFLRAVAE